MFKKKLKITKEMLQEKLSKATDCSIQHLGFPCNTCFHALSLSLRYDIHNYWLAVLAFRGDYKEIKQKPSLITELYRALS